MTSAVFSVDRRDDRWCVTVDGLQLATADSAEAACQTACEAVDIMRRSGLKADMKDAVRAPVEPRSFDPKT